MKYKVGECEKTKEKLHTKLMESNNLAWTLRKLRSECGELQNAITDFLCGTDYGNPLYLENLLDEMSDNEVMITRVLMYLERKGISKEDYQKRGIKKMKKAIKIKEIINNE